MSELASDDPSKPSIDAFQSWFTSNGGWYHPSLSFTHDALTGLSLVANDDIPTDQALVKMPVDLGLSGSICRGKVSSFFHQKEGPEFENQNSWVIFYLFLIKAGILKDASHKVYVDILPMDILTPTNYTRDELELLKFTPLYHDALERRKRFWNEYQKARVWLQARGILLPSNSNSSGSSSSLDTYSEETLNDTHFRLWIWAETSYSSRAFPPKMLTANPNHKGCSTPVLLPGVDAFNHSRGMPVSWLYPSDSDTKSDTDVVQLVMHYPLNKGAQAFNNYGPKSNEEFLAGYGFVTDEYLDDTLTLALGGGPSQSNQGQVSSSIPPSTTSLSISKPWGEKHYWRITPPSAKQQLLRKHKPSNNTSDGPPAGLLIELFERIIAEEKEEPIPSMTSSWLLHPNLATPTPTPTPTPSTGVSPTHSPTRIDSARKQDQATRLRSYEIDGQILETLEELLCAKRKQFKSVQFLLDGMNESESVRASVLKNIRIYRRGQAMILDQAIQWTRSKMDVLVELMDQLEEL
ncbi:unnamed protein product [Sympodiomycopsis kandeliae]